ncbi:T9SS type A sorting domain-containing protein [Mariniflexile sp. AS56]|uniref:T9SS type A sorting domain-containing protein n=1 Tax=Mariniflexile sp. AS56 TaxID=3063957 RepID=UPI0026F26AC2|nr:T9SS type A sorting domain-containing protein [Mariniflexile sp. AS56]MDO7171716.1 T9SS type A sorting domain-containing protein [Mariniflexile sp. AS56]
MRKLYTLVLTVFFSILSFGQNDKSWAKMGTSKNETFYDVQAKFNKFWKAKTPGKGQGYKIFKRWENQIADKIYPSGNMSLPSFTYPNFIEWQKNYNNELAKNANSKMKASLATSNWVSLNQNSIASGYDSGSGRLNFVTFDPINPATTMYVGAPDGGLWKTTNGGSSWSTHSDYLPIIGCSGLVIHPTNPNLMYLATGDKESDRRSIGVLKSTDGGLNWNTTGLVWTALDNYKITKIIMDPNNPLVMMVTTDGGIFRTTDGWATAQSPNGSASQPITFLSDIEYKPQSSSIVYAAGKEIYKSIDGGINWTPNSDLSGVLPNYSAVERIELAVTEANSNYVYAIIGRSSDQGFEGFYRSTDSGDNFSKQSTASTPNILHSDAAPTSSSVGGQAFHDLAIAVSPINVNKITIGGINQWQSTDGGVNWTRITYWLGVNPLHPGRNKQPEPYIHADIQYIAYMPGNNTTFFTTTDGGISKTTDDGVTWTDVTGNIAVGQQTNIELSEITENLFFAGLQDIGSLKYNNGSWSVLSGGDGEDGFIDRTNDDFMVSSTTNGAFFYTTNGGASYSDIPWYPDMPSGEWFSPIQQDPINVDIVYIGGRPDLYVSTDLFSGNEDITYTKTGVTPPNPAASNILRFEVAPSNNSVIYVIKENVISKSINAGSTWSDITAGLPVGVVRLKNLTVSNTDASKVWVVFSGYADDEKVYKTVDGGANWINVSNGLPNIPMNTIVYRKNSVNDEVYVGADLGVYAIDNLVASAVPFLTDLPKCAVQDLEIFYSSPTTGKLRAATYGRGSWETDLSTQTLATHEISVADSKAPVLFPNPVTNGVVNVKLFNNDDNTYQYYLYNILGEQVLKGDLNVSNSEIPLKDKSAGTYILRLISKDRMYTQKVIIK